MRSTTRFARAIGLALPTAFGVAHATAQVVVDPDLPPFTLKGNAGGKITSAGSDTMLNLMTAWMDRFRESFPAIETEAEGKGSSTAPPALTQNQVQFGPMSRAMDTQEKDEFRLRWGYEPTELIVAIDCVAIFVHKDNPIEEISLDDLREAFSVDGPDRPTWKDLGVQDAGWANRPVSLQGRNSASGTYKYFKKEALGGSDFKPTVAENPGSAGVVQAISKDPGAIGYSGIGFTTPDVKYIAIIDDWGVAVTPDQETAVNGDFPLARPLFMYINYDARKQLDDSRDAFLRFVYSREGQQIVTQDGAFPLPAEIARDQLESVGVEPGF